MATNSNYSSINNYYREFFMYGKQRYLFSNSGFLFFPIFNRKVFYFVLPGRLLSQSKRARNINRTIWFSTSVSNSHFIFTIPLYSGSIVCFS